MSARAQLRTALAERLPRARLATRPTALEPGGVLPGGAQLLVKRDDLTGLGLGGNKARKLEFLCGDAVAQGADTLVTVGAAQSNHARMTAAAGAVLGLDVHLVLGGAASDAPQGNQLLSTLFGATPHYPGTDDWDALGAALADLVAELRAAGRRPYAIPMGGSTALGAVGFADAWVELLDGCDAIGVAPSAVVHASSTGGTHGGLLAGQAAWTADGAPRPELLAVDVAKTGADLAADARRLARGALDLLGLDALAPADVTLDDGQIGPGYAVPTPAGDEAVAWAARRGAWVLDRTYTGKAFAGLLSAARGGRFGPDDVVVFWHTGGHPAVFGPGGAPTPTDGIPRTEEVT